jgi:hypothetical protein
MQRVQRVSAHVDDVDQLLAKQVMFHGTLRRLGTHQADFVDLQGFDPISPVSRGRHPLHWPETRINACAWGCSGRKKYFPADREREDLAQKLAYSQPIENFLWNQKFRRSLESPSDDPSQWPMYY